MKRMVKSIFVVFTAMFFLLPSALFAANCTDPSVGGTCKPDCLSSETTDFNYYSDCGSTQKCCVPQSVAPPTTSTVSSDSSKKSEATKVVKLDNPISVGANPSQIIGMIIKAFLGIVGGVALVMMVWGGFQWLTSAGNPEKVKSGTGTMLWAIIGLILVLASYLLVNTILQFLGGSKG